MPMRHDKPRVSNVQGTKHVQGSVTRVTNIPSVCGIVDIVLAVVEDFNEGRNKLRSFLKAVGKLFLTFVFCSYLSS